MNIKKINYWQYQCTRCNEEYSIMHGDAETHVSLPFRCYKCGAYFGLVGKDLFPILLTIPIVLLLLFMLIVWICSKL